MPDRDTSVLPLRTRNISNSRRSTNPLATDMMVNMAPIASASPSRLATDVQPVFSETGDDEELIIALGSRKVSEEVEGVVPLGDLRQAAYLKTDRGRRSLEYLIALARSKLLARAWAGEIEVVVPFAAGTGLSCRHTGIRMQNG